MKKPLKIGSKSGLRYFSMTDLRSYSPCYDPIRHLPETFRGTAVTILDNEKIPAVDRLWTVLRTDIVSEKLMRLFAVWCARQALALVKSPDPRSVAAVDVAERFANGQASVDELSAARSAARSAAESAAESAYSAAESAAYSAAESAAESAYSAARSAAWSAAWSVARSAQVNKLREMVLAEADARVKSKRQVQK